MRLVNDLRGASEEDIEALADHLYDEFDDVRDAIDAARRMPLPVRERTLEHIVRGHIERLMDVHSSINSYNVSTFTDSEKSDLALQKAMTVLDRFSPKQWETLAKRNHLSVEEVRKEVWKKTYYGFLGDE